MKRVLVVSVESPWPSNHGGRIRTAKMAEQLSRHFDVLVAFPGRGPEVQAPVATRVLPWKAPGGVRTRASRLPHLGGYQLQPVLSSLASAAVDFRPDAIYWSHSYLAAWSPPRLSEIPQVVEFANIESKRLRTLVASGRAKQKLARAVEAAKASFWEPGVARAATLCVALSEQDLKVLNGWNGRALMVPNGVDVWPYKPSPADGHILALASYDYEPNVVAIARFVADVWPAVRSRQPGARLLIAGRASEALADRFSSTPGVKVAGTLDDLSEVYDQACLSLAPASSGGGSQLKLTESMSRGRAVVMSQFAAQGLPSALRETCWVATRKEDFVQAISEALADVPGRHAREAAAWQHCGSLSWSEAVRPLVAAINSLGVRRTVP